MVTLYEDVKAQNNWNASTIQARAKRLSNLVIDIFPIVLPEMQISFSDPRYQEYTCDDPKTATYKTPSYFVLQGERVNYSTFADMLRLVISRLYVQWVNY